MAGRNHLQPNSLKHRQVPLTRSSLSSRSIDDPRLRHHRHNTSSSPARPHPAAILEERIAIQHREIQSLILDNQRLVATHVALKHELALAQRELRHLSAATADVKAERDPEVREVYEKSLKLDAEVRAIDEMSAELAQVRADVHKLGAARQDLTAQLQAINDDLTKVRSDSQQVPEIKAEIESVLKEIQRGRAAIEYEKKTRASNLEQSQAMEKNMISMAREIEKLHAELANAEKRARAAAAAANPSPGYTTSYGNPDTGYGGSPYSDPYGMHPVLVGADAGPQYVSRAMPQVHYDIQQSHAHR